MRKTIFGILLMISSASFAQQFYSVDQIQVIELEFQQSNWDYLLDSLVSNSDEGRLLGFVTVNGVLYDSVGVRYKGNSSYQASNVKNPLNIKLDYIHNNQDINGYGTIRLSNVYKDPSFIREVLGYEIAREYFPASQANYAKVFVNGTYLGLYTNVQDVDKKFCRSNFGEDEGIRIKGELAGNVLPGQMGAVWPYLGADSSLYFSKYVVESDYGWNRLVGFLDTLSNYNTFIDQRLNIDRHLWFLAFSNLFVNLDGPINNPQNFYLYRDAADRFNPIPWDLNECFGVFLQLQNNPPMNPSTAYQLSHTLNISSTSYPIISKILSNAYYKKIYLAHYKTILEEMVNSGHYLERGAEIQALIETEVQSDPNKFFTNSDFANNLNTQVGSGSSSVIGIAQLMNARKSYLAALADFQVSAPVISAITHSPETPGMLEDVNFNVTASNETGIYLNYRLKGSVLFTKVQLLDDGQHQDGAAGDHVYGISLSGLNPGIEYYILAENSAALTFSPVRAEYEFYELSFRNDLVINEFMADNSLLTDQNAETEDWIELYNNGDNAINLSGYYLADDINFKSQWQFPDTTIAAGAYLIIWADEDTTQIGLHANFKLSKSGEAIVLSNASLQVVDYYQFGAQQMDTSLGRYPNGTGDFMLMTATQGYENLGEISVEELPVPAQSRIELKQNYPNPFNESTTIEFESLQSGSLRLDIFTMDGRPVHSKSWPNAAAGLYSEQISAQGLNPGMYYYKLNLNGYSVVQKMMVY